MNVLKVENDLLILLNVIRADFKRLFLTIGNIIEKSLLLMFKFLLLLSIIAFVIGAIENNLFIIPFLIFIVLEKHDCLDFYKSL